MAADGLTFLTLEEAVALETLVERIFPETEDGPGASEALVTRYIDRQLGGPWGAGARIYREGPFPVPDHSGHGWQLAQTPAEVYRYSLAALERFASEAYGTSVAELTDDQADGLLERLSKRDVPTFADVPGDVFFNLLLENVREGLFADPSYGGNHAFIGWNWIGFPGDPDRYGEPYRRHFGDNTPYVVEKPGGLTPPLEGAY